MAHCSQSNALNPGGVSRNRGDVPTLGRHEFMTVPSAAHPLRAGASRRRFQGALGAPPRRGGGGGAEFRRPSAAWAVRALARHGVARGAPKAGPDERFRAAI